MAEAPTAVSRGLVDAASLGPYLGERLGAQFERFAVSRLGEGQSCLTFQLDGEGWSMVLRRPPRGDLPPSAFDVTREFRVISALREAGSDVPLPRPILLCEDETVIGAPFYAMEPVPGLVIRETVPELISAAAAERLGLDLLDVLAAIHAVDWRAAGLEGFGNSGAYAERQLGRMTKLWQRARFRELPEVEELGAWLEANRPPASESTIVHGDYKLDNVIVAPDGRVRAVVDWELSTIGDPLADLGWLTYYWIDDEAEVEWPRMPAASLAAGFPDRAQLLARYGERRPAPVETVRWYAALAGWKTAVMLEGSYRRYVEGNSDIAQHALLEQGVPFLARRGLGFAVGELAL
ncbi:MAG: phosphotransferase family protein [Solirubrobacterales bacterium]